MSKSQANVDFDASYRGGLLSSEATRPSCRGELSFGNNTVAVKDLFRICDGPLPVSSEASPGAVSRRLTARHGSHQEPKDRAELADSSGMCLPSFLLRALWLRLETETETETDGESCINIGRPHCPDSTLRNSFSTE